MQLPPTARTKFLRELMAEITRNYGRGRVIIAVDGVEGAGTHEFATNLAAVFREGGWEAIQASIDDFHRPREARYRDGRESARSYYADSFDYQTFRRVLIDPFRLAGSAGFQRASFDLRRDVPALTSWLTAGPDAVLIVDGVFLNRPELRGIWNYSILLDVPWDVAYERLAQYEPVDPDPDASSNARYRQGQELYFADANPRGTADAIVDNVDPDLPVRIFADAC